MYNGELWLKQPILITMKMMHRITGLPMMTKAKTRKSLGWAKVEKRTLVEWNERGIKVSNIIDIELKFGIHIIAQKI